MFYGVNSPLNLKYLKLTKMELSRFAMKLFKSMCDEMLKVGHWAKMDPGPINIYSQNNNLISTIQKTIVMEKIMISICLR